MILFVAHYLGDYTHLSRPSMLAAKRIGYPYPPIFAHAMVHAIIVLVVCCVFVGKSSLQFRWDVCDVAFIIELITHFVIDVLKGKCNVWFPKVSQPQNISHWYIFGFDQLLHHLVLVVIWVICTTT